MKGIHKFIMTSIKSKYLLTIPIVLLTITIFNGIFLSSIIVNADGNTSTTDTLNITVNSACTMMGGTNGDSTSDNTFTATIDPSTYQEFTGSKLTTLCNDKDGYAIYAIGYSGNSYDAPDNTKLLGQGTIAGTNINTGTSGDNSYWAMKLTSVSGTTPPTILNNFNNYHVIPETYTAIAKHTTNTSSSTSAGATIQTNYKVNIGSSQIAGSYQGKVKYTMVHPNTGPEPLPEIINADLRTVIEDNIMINPELYTAKTQLVRVLKADPDFPAEYKDYLIENEAQGNPKCNRAELVNRIKAETTISSDIENAILNDDRIFVSGKEFDLRVFDKQVDGVYVNGIRLMPASISSSIYDGENRTVLNYPQLLEVIQEDIAVFDYKSYVEDMMDDYPDISSYFRFRNYQPGFDAEPTTDYSFDIIYPFSFNYTLKNPSNGSEEIIDYDFSLHLARAVTNDCDIETGGCHIVLGELSNNHETASMSILYPRYENWNEIDNYVNHVRSLIYQGIEQDDILVVHNGVHYEGMNGISDLNTLTKDEFNNIINTCTDWTENLSCSVPYDPLGDRLPQSTKSKLYVPPIF